MYQVRFSFSNSRLQMRIGSLLLVCVALLAPSFAQISKRAPIPVAPEKRAGTSLIVVVIDENNIIVADALVVLTDRTSGEAIQIHTDAAGRGRFLTLNPEHSFTIQAQKGNFYSVTEQELHIAGAQTLELTLPHVQELKETVNVTASTQGIDPAQTADTKSLGTPEIVNIPYPTSRDIRNILPFLPQVVQDSTGQVHVAGADTYETTDVLDGFEITSPVSGILAMRFSADAVREVSVQSSRVSTQFGKESGGIIDFNTGMGDDHLRFDAKIRACVLDGGVEKRVGSRITRIVAIHRRRRDADDADDARFAHDGTRQWMGRMRFLVALRRALEIDEQSSVLDARLITRHAIVFESRLALAGARVKLPVVPRTDDVIAVESSVAERTTDVIADAGDDAELTVEVRDGKFVAPYDDRLQ